MIDNNITKRIALKGKPHRLSKQSLARLDAMSDEEIERAALSDADNLPLSDRKLKEMRRVSCAKHVRLTLGMTQEAFAGAFGIPIGTLRDWEQHRTEPDQAAQSYLKVIAAMPEDVRGMIE